MLATGRLAFLPLNSVDWSFPRCEPSKKVLDMSLRRLDHYCRPQIAAPPYFRGAFGVRAERAMARRSRSGARHTGEYRATSFGTGRFFSVGVCDHDRVLHTESGVVVAAVPLGDSSASECCHTPRYTRTVRHGPPAGVVPREYVGCSVAELHRDMNPEPATGRPAARATARLLSRRPTITPLLTVCLPGDSSTVCATRCRLASVSEGHALWHGP